MMNSKEKGEWTMNRMTLDLMKDLLQRQHPGWDGAYLERCAAQQLAELDPRLGDILYSYCTYGTTSDFSHTHRGETFSVLEIRAMRRCGYPEAVFLMNGYIRNPASGRARILRR